MTQEQGSPSQEHITPSQEDLSDSSEEEDTKQIILDSSPENEEYEDLTITQATPLVSPSIHPIGRYTVADVAERVGPSVVRVVVPSSDKRKKSQGSGFFIDRKRVLTCAHVVVDTDEEGEILSYPDKVVLKTHNGNFVDAKLLTHTVSLHYDIAVLEITSEETFQPVMFGNSRQVLLGGWVIAFGSPNYMDRTLSLGTINCIDRTDVELRLPKHKRIFYFQCDCMLNVGNMGGPLVDLEGNVIALISMAFVGGIGISVPIHTVRKFLKDKF
ncbi:hypothetical protein ARALYDRAFT_334364 [Arabidopsis lyrata subsp. lyrata]|uniref:Trypsin family protein n=1 Tax=Arabidopsis lyrata subsp. lyrata TaxID=81972 RepID=D7KLI1_ARALL|nr:hypothetical protein ARALYDRAFT_334364 [Arabidopsis lyrata subsp. lyrata]